MVYRQHEGSGPGYCPHPHRHPASAFGSLVAILPPYVGWRIHEVTTAMATLGDVGSWRQGKLGHDVRKRTNTKPKVEVHG